MVWQVARALIAVGLLCACGPREPPGGDIPGTGTETIAQPIVIWGEHSWLSAWDGIGETTTYPSAVALDPYTALVGATDATLGGAAYVFRRISFGWLGEQKLESPVALDP